MNATADIIHGCFVSAIFAIWPIIRRRARFRFMHCWFPELNLLVLMFSSYSTYLITILLLVSIYSNIVYENYKTFF